MLSSFSCLLLGIVALLIVKRFISARSRSALPLPPGPPPLPLIGNVHQAAKIHPWLQQHEWSKTYGPIMHLNMLGQPVIILSTVKAAHDLLSKRGATYSDRPRLVVAAELALKNQHILLRPYDEGYKLHQRLEASLLHAKASTSYRPFQDLESRQLLFDILNAKGSSVAGINPHEHLERATASGIFAIVFGYRLQTPHEPELKQAHAVQLEFAKIGQVGEYLVDSFPVLNDLPLPRFMTPWKKDAERHFQAQRSLHVSNMERALQTPGWNFTKQMKANPEAEGLPEEEIAFNLGILADAALDTTTMTMDWFIVAVLTQREQGFVEKAQKMIDETIGRNRLPAWDDRAKIPYIDAIVEELMRWRPIGAGGVPHRNMVEDSYEGYLIPKGSVVIANHWAVTRDESVFGKDGDQFIPERWLPDGEATASVDNKIKSELDGALKDLPTIGFGYGRRACPGRHIARNSLWMQIARLLWAFDIQPAETIPDPMAGTSGFVTMPLPYQAVFKPRSPEVVDSISSSCSTWNENLVGLLDKVGNAQKMRN